MKEDEEDGATLASMTGSRSVLYMLMISYLKFNNKMMSEVSMVTVSLGHEQHLTI